MLKESKGVMQERNAPTYRRWFQDEDMELIVWYNAGGTVEGFQICYHTEDQREHALTWRAGGLFTHARVQSGDSRPDKNLTPILVQDGPVPWEWLSAEFAARAHQLESGVRELVFSAFAGRKN